MSEPTLAAVHKTITVQAGAERAFSVFTDDIDSWWPRSHHIGKMPMQKAVIEGWPGGRCYSEQVDGSECPWGRVLVWEPPARLVFAWQIGADWQYEPDLAQSSEVEVRFTPQPDGSTRVDLEHRNLERMRVGGQAMRTAVDSPGGWDGLLQMYAGRAAAA